jgi:hypothetical protein
MGKKISYDSGDSGSKKYKRGYAGTYGGVCVSRDLEPGVRRSVFVGVFCRNVDLVVVKVLSRLM